MYLVSKNEKRKNIGRSVIFCDRPSRRGPLSSFYDVTWLDDARPLAYSSFCARQKLSLSLTHSPSLSSFLSSDFENRNVRVLCALRSLYFDHCGHFWKRIGVQRGGEKRVGQWWAKFNSPSYFDNLSCE